MAEFAPAFAMFIFAFFPLLDLLGVGMGIATAQFIGSQAIGKAAVANTPADAVDAMYSELDRLAESNFCKFANITIDGTLPLPPSSPSGPTLFVPRSIHATKLYVVRTNIQSQVTEHASAPPPDQFDPNTYIYEYYGVASFRISPFINLSGIPGLGLVPGLGQSYNFRYTAARAVESTEDFNLSASPNSTRGWASSRGAGSSGPSWQQGMPH